MNTNPPYFTLISSLKTNLLNFSVGKSTIPLFIWFNHLEAEHQDWSRWQLLPQLCNLYLCFYKIQLLQYVKSHFPNHFPLLFITHRNINDILFFFPLADQLTYLTSNQIGFYPQIFFTFNFSNLHPFLKPISLIFTSTLLKISISIFIIAIINLWTYRFYRTPPTNTSNNFHSISLFQLVYHLFEWSTTSPS